MKIKTAALNDVEAISNCFVPQRYAFVVDLYVTASSRRKGIGTLLLNAVKQ